MRAVHGSVVKGFARYQGTAPVRRFSGGPFRSVLNSVMSVVDPDRVSAKEVAAQIKGLEQKMTSEGAERQAELKNAIAGLKAEQSAHEKQAKSREWFLGLAGLALSFAIWWDDTWDRLEIVAVSRILRSRVSPLEPHMYVERPKEEARISPLMGVPSLEYDVVVGPRGCGKSSVVLHVASKHRGVVTFSVSSATDNAYVRTADAFGISSKHYKLTDHHELVKLFKKASLWRSRLDWARSFFSDNKPSGVWVPTIVAEIDHETGQGTIAAIAKQLKIVASDNKAARVVLVLSDANAQFALPGDAARQEIIWVEDLTEAEARAVMDKNNFVATEAEKQLIFGKVGTRVADLTRLIGDMQKKKFASVDDAVKARIADAKVTFNKLLEIKFRQDDPNKIDFKKIFDELLKSPSGVPVSKLRGPTGIPEDCGMYFKKHHAFSYYNPKDSYIFYSIAHLEAAKELRAEGKY